jgi:hypothetical protein
MDLESIQGIFGTGGQIAAAGAKPGGNSVAVEIDEGFEEDI